MAWRLLMLCRPATACTADAGDGLTVAVAGQQRDQDALHAAPGDGLPAAGLAGGVGQVQGPGQPRIGRRGAAAQVEPHLAVVPGGHGSEQRQLGAAGAGPGSGRRRRLERAAFLAVAAGQRPGRGAPAVHPGEEQLVVADLRQPGGQHDRRPGIGRRAGAVVRGPGTSTGGSTRP